MTATRTGSRRILLANGGDLCINLLGGLWTVDVFDFCGTEPVYHAAYTTRDEADADASCWAVW
jgi:hypothetical protein